MKILDPVRKRNFTGYQVRTEDLRGISFTHLSLDKYKKYCRQGFVIVSTYAKFFGIKFRIFWLPYYKPIRWEKYAQVINVFNLHIGWEKMYRDAVDEVVYKP